jgi:hypothetical protein
MRAADGKAVANIAKVLADGRYGNSPPHIGHSTAPSTAPRDTRKSPLTH